MKTNDVSRRAFIALGAAAAAAGAVAKPTIAAEGGGSKQDAARDNRRLTIWPVSDWDRVFPHDAPPAKAAELCRQGWHLSAARGEYCYFQLGLQSAERVAVTALPLRKGADAIPPEAFQVRWVGLVPVSADNVNAGGAERPECVPGWYPDPLMEEMPWNDPPRVTAAGSARPRSIAVCMILRVPRDAAAGAYRGAVEVSLKGEGKITVPLTVNVWPFAIPATPSLHVTNWILPDCVAQWHQCEPWSERHWKLLDLYAADMAAHRQDVIWTPAFTEISNVGGTPLVKTTLTKDGEYRFDFRAFDRWINLFDRHGFQLFELWHLTSNKWAPPYSVFEEESGRTVRRGDQLISPEYRKVLAQFLRELSRRLDQRNLSERCLLHVYDEPAKETWPLYAELSAFVKEHAPKLKQINAVSTSDLISEFGAKLDIPVPLTSYLVNDTGWQKRAKEGKLPLWWYTCCGPGHPFANRFISHPLLNTRMLSWQTYAFRISGYLHWGYNFWYRFGGIAPRMTNPYRDSANPQDWPAGDCCIVYPHPNPAADHGPISSLRYEAHRAGLQDYELLKMLADVARHGSGDKVREQAEKLLAQVRGPIAGSLTEFTRDTATLASVRQQIGDCIAAGLP